MVKKLTPVLEGMEAAKSGLHIKQNPYSTRNWMDGDLRELTEAELRKLYNKCSHWNRGYRFYKKQNENGKEVCTGIRV